MNLIFLHIPKTAGQSIHSQLERNFPGEVAPLRTNVDFAKHSTAELMRYRVFSGHLDWDRLDFVAQPRIVITVLRDPLERVVSFYRYLRKRANEHTEDELSRPTQRGMWLVRNLTLEDYFCDASLPERSFLDNHYDNFYTSFFSSRNYNGNEKVKQGRQTGRTGNTEILDQAEQNLRCLNMVADIRRLGELEAFLSACYHKPFNLSETRINVDKGNQSHVGDPFAKLREFDLTDRAEARIREMCALDNELLARVGKCQTS